MKQLAEILNEALAVSTIELSPEIEEQIRDLQTTIVNTSDIENLPQITTDGKALTIGISTLDARNHHPTISPEASQQLIEILQALNLKKLIFTQFPRKTGDLNITFDKRTPMNLFDGLTISAPRAGIHINASKDRLVLNNTKISVGALSLSINNNYTISAGAKLKTDLLQLNLYGMSTVPENLTMIIQRSIDPDGQLVVQYEKPNPEALQYFEDHKRALIKGQPTDISAQDIQNIFGLPVSTNLRFLVVLGMERTARSVEIYKDNRSSTGWWINASY